MTVIIIEDEPLAAKNLIKLILEFDDTIEVYPVAESVDQAVTLLNNVHPDLIFIDIELADGSSFEIFKYVEVTAPVIFTTAYDQYSLQAFEVNSIAYLLKPITLEKLKIAFSNYEKMRTAFNVKSLNKALTDLSSLAKKYKNNFLVRRGKKLIPIETEAIAYFVAIDKWVYLVTHTDEKYVVNYNLSQLNDILNPINFHRINRQYLVSKKSVTWLEPYYKGQVCVSLSPKTEVQVVSRKVTPLLKEWLTE